MVFKILKKKIIIILNIDVWFSYRPNLFLAKKKTKNKKRMRAREWQREKWAIMTNTKNLSYLHCTYNVIIDGMIYSVCIEYYAWR